MEASAGSCASAGILRFFGNDEDSFEAVAAQGEAAVLAAVSSGTYPDGGAVNRDGYFLGFETDASGRILSASTVLWVRTLCL